MKDGTDEQAARSLRPLVVASEQKSAFYPKNRKHYFQKIKSIFRHRLGIQNLRPIGRLASATGLHIFMLPPA